MLTTLALGIALGSYRVAPDWMFMYFGDGLRPGPAGLAYMALVLYYVPFAAG